MLAVMSFIAILIALGGFIYSYQSIISLSEKINEIERLLLVKVELTIDYGNGTVKACSVNVKSGASLLDALSCVADVETQKFDFGLMVQSINGVKNNPGTSKFWVWYVWKEGNWSLGPVGADQYLVKNGEKYKWAYERFKG